MLSRENQRVISYWRQSIFDSLRSEVRGGGNPAAELPQEDIARGHCSPALYLDLRQRAVSSEKRGRSAPLDGSPLPVLLCPLLLSRAAEVSFGPRIIELLWVPALLDQSGELHPPPRGAPWIPRTLLDPQVSDDYPVIGKDEDLSEFTAAAGRRIPEDWESYWRFVEELFAAVSRSSIRNFELRGFARRRNAVITLDAASSTSTLTLAEVYERTLAGEQHPGLIPALARINLPAQKPFRESKRWVSKMAFRHCGQFGNAFPLALSQRRAVHRTLALEDGEYLCVTGPPGTGKTTLLQSIIASLWVHAAIHGRPYPPIIVGTGATNQAVTNVIAAMEKSGNDESGLASRWLPRLKSYGTFCASATRAQDSLSLEGYQLETLRGESFSRSLCSTEYLSEAKRFYLDNFHRCFGKSTGLAKAVRFLRGRINSERKALYKSIERTRDGSFTEWLQALFFLGPGKTADAVCRDLAALDNPLRYQLFLLAGRYWEGRWLLEAAAMQDDDQWDNSEREGASNAHRLATAERDWQRRAMLTPAFVCTIPMLPRFFWNKRAPQKPPIDLLIFDEASQITPERGAACLGLARRALIVGDDQQLEPVWEVPSNVDRANAAKFGLTGRDEKDNWKELNRKGMLASSGSMMRWSLHCSLYNDGASTIGVFLSEQRRSVPEIVAVSNDLAYRNRLQPLRPELAQRILPALGYFHVQGRAERAGTSRLNRTEAEAIESWIGRQREKLLDYYRCETLEEVLAVLSPFAAQIELLARKLNKSFAEDRLLIGTVNAMQGAEKPVVLFSTVYDTSFNDEYFFDRSSNMLNVAVSRAKDSFITFGDTALYRGRVGRPSWVLSRRLFADDENDITEELAPLERLASEEHRAIASLESHREALRSSLTEVKRELVIVSPTISAAAVRADRVPELIGEARARGVSVTIYTDCDLDLDDNGLKPRAAEGRRLLIEAGARLFVVNGIHCKAIGVDGAVYIDGSFNWLSANRTAGSRHQKLETSNYYRGKEAARRIKLLKDEMQYRGFVDQNSLVEDRAAENEEPPGQRRLR